MDSRLRALTTGLYMREVDSALQAMGASRSVGNDCKSTARLICPEASRHEHADWDTVYIHETCVVKEAGESPKVLGVHVGGAAAPPKIFECPSFPDIMIF